jgi:hypothetical protein
MDTVSIIYTIGVSIAIAVGLAIFNLAGMF